MKLYPILFHPIFKERIWGGTKLKDFLGKSIPEGLIGESWEISTIEGSLSKIANGTYQGAYFQDLVVQFPLEILGVEVVKKFGNDFPLLLKFLDANTDLSIQVHPDDTLAMKRHNSFGKNEMWYIMQADPEAQIISGFKDSVSSVLFLERLKGNSLLKILDKIKVKKGDAYYLESGTVHSIGKGLLIAEIQQKSDITYRLYDFDRIDKDGKKRELHTDLALDAINYNKIDTYRSHENVTNISNKLVNCKSFTTNVLPLVGRLKINKNDSSFTIYMCVEGSFSIIYNDTVFQFNLGDTILIPAKMQCFELNGKATLLEIYI
jgi:mannose-6-phosphate isomerase